MLPPCLPGFIVSAPLPIKSEQHHGLTQNGAIPRYWGKTQFAAIAAEHPLFQVNLDFKASSISATSSIELR